MPSLVPLNNAVAQSSVDFNNQTPSNASGLFRYKVNDRTASSSWVFNDSDLNSVCIFSKSLVTVGLATFSSTPPIGTEIIFYSTGGAVYIYGYGGATLITSKGPYTVPLSGVGKITHIGSNVWVFSSANSAQKSYTWSSCCGGSQSFYYIEGSTPFTSVSASPSRFYTSSGLNIPFNGTILNPVDGLYYNMVNGYWDTGTPAGSCPILVYSSSYTFYTGPDPIYDPPVTLYSVGALDINNPAYLKGHKFFTTSVGNQYDCYTTDVVSPGTLTVYYPSLALAPSTPIIFQDGYVVNIDSYL